MNQVGEEELVLAIGRAAVQRPDAKPYIHDLLLSMALAEVSLAAFTSFNISFAMPAFLIICAFLKCSIAKIGFEKNKVYEGFEALARAQCLLRSTKSLRQLTLLSQVIVFSILCFFLYLTYSRIAKICFGSVCKRHPLGFVYINDNDHF